MMASLRFPTSIVLVAVTSASVAYADKPTLVRIDPPAKARAEAIAATVVTGLFVGGTFAVHERSQQLGREASDLSLGFAPATQQQQAIDRTDRWHEATYVLAGVTLVSVA